MSKSKFTFALLGSLMTIVFFILTNLFTSRNNIWFIYPSFAIIWWPITVLYKSKNNYKEYSLVASILAIIFLLITNYTTSAVHPWFLYPLFPIICWPITMYSGRHAQTFRYSIIISISAIFYYSFLNFLLSPIYPWAIYPTYLILWWPISLFYSRKRQYFEFSIAGSILTILFFIVVNAVSSPDVIWAIYPIFGILWWPLSQYFFGSKKRRTTLL